MLRFLRLPCALLALLLSALGGTRLPAIETLDDQRTKIPISSPAPATAALPDAPAPVPGPPVASLVVINGEWRPSFTLIIPEGVQPPAPSQRRGSAGGARAP